MRRLLDTMRFKWFKWVIEYDLYRQLSLFRDLRDQVSGGASSVKEWIAAIKQWFANHLFLHSHRRGPGHRHSHGDRMAQAAPVAEYSGIFAISKRTATR